MYYIRFLKAPQLNAIAGRRRALEVKSLITITSDLGDEFYPSDANITACVMSNDYEEMILIRRQDFRWKAHARVLPLRLEVQLLDLSQEMRLVVVLHDGSLREPNFEVDLSALPSALPAWSEDFSLRAKVAEPALFRRFLSSQGDVISIREGFGDSIARHIWDAGLGLAAYFNTSKYLQEADELAATVRTALEAAGSGCGSAAGSGKMRAIELGTGCGIVGITLAQCVAGAEVVLTDLQEAHEMAGANLACMRPARARFEALEWGEPLPSAIAAQAFDLIVAADCTYNPSTAPALVESIRALVLRSPGALVLVATKVRHPSEAVFFDLMAAAGLEQVAHSQTQLSRFSAEGSPAVQIYAFRRGRALTPGSCADGSAEKI